MNIFRSMLSEGVLVVQDGQIRIKSNQEATDQNG
jgi:hypothetical protein